MPYDAGIPDDFAPNESAVYTLTGGLPSLWHHLYYDIAGIHQKFRDLGQEPGEGEAIAINDTGSTVHDLLPEPVAARSFIPGEAHRSKHMHGPHCSGIALGRDGLGVAPGAKLIIAKVLSDSGSGSNSAINAGRVWAAKEGATIISESLGDGGGPPFREDLEAFDQAYEAGTSLCVAALGNSGTRGVGRPGSYDRSAGIANHRRDGKIATSSSRGETADIAGPGTAIISCDARGGLMEATGTSMACPFVAGCFALIRHWMRITGTPIPQGHEAWRAWWQSPEFIKDVGAPGKDTSFGDGVLRMTNVLKAIRMSTWILAFVLLSMSMTSAQQPLTVDVKQSEVITRVETVSKTSTIFAGEVLGNPKTVPINVTETVENVISIESDQPIRQASAITKSFEFGELTRLSDQRYILRGKPDTYLVTVYTGDDFVQTVVKLEGSEPPVDSDLAKKLKAKLPDDPKFAAVLADAYAGEIRSAAGKTLAELRRGIGRAKIAALNKPRDTSQPWNSFFLVVDRWAEDREVSVEQYQEVLAIVESVLREGSSVSVLTFDWTPPPNPYIGQIHDGRQLIKVCENGACRLVWRKITE